MLRLFTNDAEHKVSVKTTVYNMTAFYKVKLFNLAEDEIKFESFNKFSLLLFKIICIDFQPLSMSASTRSKIVHYAKLMFAHIALASYALALIQLIVHSVIVNSFIESLSALNNSLSVILILLKVSITFSNKKIIWKIMNDLKIILDAVDNKNGKYRYKKYFNSYQLIMKIGVFIFLSSIPPVIYNGLRRDDFSLTLWFPFDTSSRATMYIALIWLDWALIVGIIFFLSSDSLLYALITVITMSFDILKRDLMDLKLEPKDVRRRTLKSLIPRHNKLLDLCDETQKVYSPTFFGSFGVSSILLCTFMFLLSSGEFDFANFILFASFMGLFFGQVFRLCLYGQKIIDSTLGIAEGAYDSLWSSDDHDNSFNIEIGLIILRAQRPKQLTAMKFTKVSLESFTTVVTSIHHIYDLISNYLFFSHRF